MVDLQHEEEIQDLWENWMRLEWKKHPRTIVRDGLQLERLLAVQ